MEFPHLPQFLHCQLAGLVTSVPAVVWEIAESSFKWVPAMNKLEGRFKIINRGCNIITVGCDRQGIISFELTTMHKLGYCLLEEVFHILDPATASRVVGVTLGSFYT